MAVTGLPYIVLVAFYVLQIERNGVLPRVGLVYVADAMRGQVDLPILLVGQLILSAEKVTISAYDPQQATITATWTAQVKDQAGAGQ